MIVPVFDRPGLLVEAVESAVAQSYRPIEVLIVDDASTDETPTAAKGLTTRYPDVVRVVTLARRQGPGPARNAGLRESRGEYIQFLDSDDLLLPEKLERQVALLKSRPECGVVYCRSARIGTDGTKATSHRSDEDFDTILPGFLDTRGWPTHSPLWRRSTCVRIGAFTAHKVLEDWLWDVRAGMLGVVVACCPEELCVVRDLDVPRAGKTKAGYSSEQWEDAFSVRKEIATLLAREGLGFLLPRTRYVPATFQMVRQCAVLGHERQAREGLSVCRGILASRKILLEIALFRLTARVLGVKRAAWAAEGIWRWTSAWRWGVERKEA